MRKVRVGPRGVRQIFKYLLRSVADKIIKCEIPSGPATCAHSSHTAARPARTRECQMNTTYDERPFYKTSGKTLNEYSHTHLHKVLELVLLRLLQIAGSQRLHHLSHILGQFLHEFAQLASFHDEASGSLVLRRPRRRLRLDVSAMLLSPGTSHDVIALWRRNTVVFCCEAVWRRLVLFLSSPLASQQLNETNETNAPMTASNAFHQGDREKTPCTGTLFSCTGT